MLAGDKFLPGLHLRQPAFTYSACGTFTKLHERIQKFEESGNLKPIYKNEKGCFSHYAAYSESKDLAKRTISDKNLKERAYEMLHIPNMMDIKED